MTINKQHKYYTPCVMQMGVAGFSLTYFFVWTSHDHIINDIDFKPKS